MRNIFSAALIFWPKSSQLFRRATNLRDNSVQTNMYDKGTENWPKKSGMYMHQASSNLMLSLNPPTIVARETYARMRMMSRVLHKYLRLVRRGGCLENSSRLSNWTNCDSIPISFLQQINWVKSNGTFTKAKTSSKTVSRSHERRVFVCLIM